MGPQALRMNLNTLLRHDVFSVKQLSSTVSEASTNFASNKRLGQSFYTMVDYVTDRIVDESEIRRSKQFPYQTVQACERADIMNIGGFSDAVFNVISAFLADNNQRFVAEVEAIEL